MSLDLVLIIIISNISYLLNFEDGLFINRKKDIVAVPAAAAISTWKKLVEESKS